MKAARRARHRPTSRRTWPPTPPACSTTSASSGPRRRRVDGRDDRPDHRHRAPDPRALADVDHVDDGRARRREADARGMARSIAPAGDGSRDRPSSGGPDHQVIGGPDLFDEDRIRDGGGGLLRPRLRPVGTVRQLLGDHGLGQPSRAAGGTRRADARDPRRCRHARHADRRAAHRRARPRRRAAVVEGMGHELPAAVWPQVVEAITGTPAAPMPPDMSIRSVTRTDRSACEGEGSWSASDKSRAQIGHVNDFTTAAEG